jgi:phosphohistidine phosphatase
VDLYLVRHAVAEPRDPERRSDAKRPLTPDGVERFRAVAVALRRLGVLPDRVLASTYVRAWRTAELLLEEAEWPAPEPSPELEPPSSAAACLSALATIDEETLGLIGHEPHLGELASLALTGSEGAVAFELKKGGVICLRFPSAPTPGQGFLRWSASPRILRRIGR